jgi:chromosome partitioning protein
LRKGDMPAIVFVSSKGGTGKTTAALLLALGLERAGQRVAMIDCDPNLPLYSWRKKATFSSVRVFPATTLEELQDVAPLARARADWLVIDTEGSARGCNFVAAVEPDLALIPVGASSLEAVEAIRTSKSLREIPGRTQPFVPHACVLTRIPVAIKSRSLGSVIAMLKEEQISLIDTPIIEKEAFRTIFAVGGSLHSLDDSLVSGLAVARANATQFSDAVVKLFKRPANAAPAPERADLQSVLAGAARVGH